MARKKLDTVQAASVAQPVSSENREQGEIKSPRYVVVREGHRVSPDEYSTPDDPKALEEMKVWQTVAQKHSWGEPVAIVAYDNKLHRVW